jgi:hypothetical protein
MKKIGETTNYRRDSPHDLPNQNLASFLEFKFRLGGNNLSSLGRDISQGSYDNSLLEKFENFAISFFRKKIVFEKRVFK